MISSSATIDVATASAGAIMVAALVGVMVDLSRFSATAVIVSPAGRKTWAPSALAAANSSSSKLSSASESSSELLLCGGNSKRIPPLVVGLVFIYLTKI